MFPAPIALAMQLSKGLSETLEEKQRNVQLGYILGAANVRPDTADKLKLLKQLRKNFTRVEVMHDLLVKKQRLPREWMDAVASFTHTCGEMNDLFRQKEAMAVVTPMAMRAYEVLKRMQWIGDGVLAYHVHDPTYVTQTLEKLQRQIRDTVAINERYGSLENMPGGHVRNFHTLRYRVRQLMYLHKAASALRVNTESKANKRQHDYWAHALEDVSEAMGQMHDNHLDKAKDGVAPGCHITSDMLKTLSAQGELVLQFER